MNIIRALLFAFFLAIGAPLAGADSSDSLDPSDGGADWDGDGLTNAEEQSHGTNMNNADSDGDGLPDGWEVGNGLSPTNGGDANDSMATVSPTRRNTRNQSKQRRHRW